MPRLSIIVPRPTVLGALLILAVAKLPAVEGYFLEIESYDVDATLSPAEDHLAVEATVVIANRTFYPLEVMDLYFHGDAQIHGVTVSGEAVAYENIGSRGQDTRRLVLQLDPPVPVDHAITVTASYELTYIETGGGASIGPGATHLLTEARWTPFLHDFLSDHGGDYAPARVSVTVPADETVVMPGNMVSEERTEESVRYAWESALSGIPVIVSGRYRTVEVGSAETQAVGYLYEEMGEREEAAMRTLLEQAIEVYDLYTELLGPLPEAPLRIVAVERRGGYGLPRCLLLNHRTFDFEGEPTRDTSEFLAHEIAHSWFPGLLRPRERAAGMMSEALATYLATLATEQIHGEGAALRAWRDHHAVYAALDEDFPLFDQNYRSPGYSISTYNKGAQWWRTLERRLGRETLLGLLGDFAQENALDAVAFDDMLAWLNERTPDDDLEPLWRWYLGTTELANVGLRGEPRVRPQGEGFEVEFTVEVEGFDDLPYDVELTLADDSTVRETRTIGDGDSQHIALTVPAPPVSIALDPDCWLLQSRARDDQWPRALDAQGHYRAAAAAWRSGTPEEGLEPIAQALARQPENAQFLLMAGILLAATDDLPAAAEHLEQARDFAPESDDSITRAWTLVHLGRVRRALGDRDAARGFWYQVMNTDATGAAHAEAQGLMRALDREIEEEGQD